MQAGEAIVIVLGVLLLVLPWIAIRDVLRHPRERWSAVGASRWLWITVIVVLPVLGAALYIRRVRPQLRARTLG